MPNRHSVSSLIFLSLLIIGLGLSGCSDDEASVTGTGGAAPSNGGVYIQTEPSDLVVPWVLTKPDGNAVSGVNNQSLVKQAGGLYSLSWPRISGWNEPQPSTVERTLAGNNNINFTGIYLPQPGTVIVKSIPEGLDASWSFYGFDFDYEASASGDTTLTNVPPGKYLMTWDDVEDFETPSSTLFSVNNRNALFLNGYFSFPDSMVVINPVVSDDASPWTFIGPAGDTPDTVYGVGRTKIELSFNGQYTVTWGDVDQFITPAAQTLHVVLEEDAQFNLTAIYTPVRGSVGITASFGSTELKWALTGPTGTVQTGAGDAVLEGMRPGVYSLVATEQDGWIPGAPDSDNLSSSGGISLSVTAEAAVSILAQPTDLDPSWTLTGPGGYSFAGSGDQLIGDLTAGSYTLTWDDVDGWTVPEQSTQTLDANTGIVFSGILEQGASSLHINTFPLAETASWSIVGPGGYNQSGSGTVTLPISETGPYTVTWAEVTGYMLPTAETLVFAGNSNIEFRAGYQELLDLVTIPAGSYTQGSYFQEGCRSGIERQHPVTMTQDLIIKTTEVTNAEFIAMAQWALDRGYATANQYGLNDNIDGSTVELLDLDDGDQEIFYADGRLTTNAANHPVKEVSWYGAVAYCDWLSMYRGFERAYNHNTWKCGTIHPSFATGFRLPTEAEWEYACRAGSTTAFANGIDIFQDFQGNCTSNNLSEVAWYDLSSEAWSHEVGLLDPNAWGLYDMHGNVMEWCNDWADEEYFFFLEALGPEENPPGPLFGDKKVARGGYFFSLPGDCRSASRNGLPPSNASYDTGFRVVISGN